jgi:hypothetical protein
LEEAELEEALEEVQWEEALDEIEWDGALVEVWDEELALGQVSGTTQHLTR